MQAIIFLKSLPWLSIVGLVVTVATGVHILALGLSAKYAWAAKVAEVSGVIGQDAQQILQWAQGAPLVAQKIAKVAVVLLVGLLACIGCNGVPAKTVIADACTVIDSGNPAIGALCLTAEEIASLFGHVRAARAFRASHPGAAPGGKVDVCAGEVTQ